MMIFPVYFSKLCNLEKKKKKKKKNLWKAYGLFEGLKDAELSRTFRFNTCSAGPSGFCSRRVESLQHTTRILVILQNDLADDESEQIRRKFWWECNDPLFYFLSYRVNTKDDFIYLFLP